MFDVTQLMDPDVRLEDAATATVPVTGTGDTPHTRGDLVRLADDLHAAIGRAARALFGALREIDRTGAWDDDGARDLPHWVQMRYGVSAWKAHRWVDAAHALADLPRVDGALGSGELGIDKVVELTRFATPRTEDALVAWARTVSSGAIRRRAELEARRPTDASADLDRSRRLRWWLTDEGRRFELMAELPSADGALVAGAIERMAATLPEMPDEPRAENEDARRADAFVALCTGSRRGSVRSAHRRGGPARRLRPRIVVHAPLSSFLADASDASRVSDAGRAGAAAQLTPEGIPSLDGGVIDAPTLRRLACDADLQLLISDRNGEPLRLGRTVREPSAALARAVRSRDRECRFPGCGARRHTDAHHVVWWSRGGATDVENLVLLCGFHHRLVHEHGWGVRRCSDGSVRWLRPDGTRYRSGPSPPT